MKVKELKVLLDLYDNEQEIYVYDVHSDIYDIFTVDKFEHWTNGIFLFPDNRRYDLEKEVDESYSFFYKGVYSLED